MQREPGFYWVKGKRGSIFEGWRIGWWIGGEWRLWLIDTPFLDVHFAHIGPRLTPPEEN